MEDPELCLQIFITWPCKFVITIDLIQTQRLASFIVLLLFKYFCLICILFSCQIRSTIKIPGMSGTVSLEFWLISSCFLAHWTLQPPDHDVDCPLYCCGIATILDRDITELGVT